MPYIGNSPANVGNFQVVDDISSTFNGTLTSFALTALTLPINPAKSGQLLVSINGVLQEPDDTGTEGFLGLRLKHCILISTCYKLNLLGCMARTSSRYWYA